ncbi:MAG: adenylosuccinate synthase [Bdellovibrionia bacterium]
MNVVVVGAQWGDEGKGKVVDLFSSKAEYIVRYQGGNNAGHTLVVKGVKTVLHLIPSGILHPGKICLIANGVVFDPGVFFKEVEALQAAGALRADAHAAIRVSERAHVILPYHRILDQLREEHAAGGKIGTTVRGIGPAYEDKVARRGIQVIDLLRPELLRSKLTTAVEEKNILLKHHFNHKTIEFDALYEECLKLGERLRPYIADVRGILVQALKDKRQILFEGAQGTLLDVDHGTYPFVTSSNTVAAGALTGSGVGLNAISQVIGITKAYTTRVGAGPFPTEMKSAEQETADRIRKVGMEFGATTGRPRRTGWLDLVALKYAVEVNGLTGLALMKADVLQNFDSIKVCTGYRLGSTTLFDLPSCAEDLERIEPVYEVMPGWGSYDPKAVHTLADLPIELQKYMTFIQEFLGVPIVIMSTGAGREETLHLDDPFQ